MNATVLDDRFIRVGCPLNSLNPHERRGAPDFVYRGCSH